MIQRRNYGKIAIQEEDVLNYLQSNKKSSSKSNAKVFSSDIKIRIGELKNIAIDLFQPKGIFYIFKQNELPFRECFAEAERVALAIVTIGASLPFEVSRLMNSGEYVDGVVLDAFGSAGVERVADKMNDEINEVVRSRKLDYSKRFSPGYCSWSVKDQKIIFDRLPAEEIGVSLSDGYMMHPIKSVSFAINIGSQIKKSKWESRCKTCEDRGQCTYRM